MMILQGPVPPTPPPAPPFDPNLILMNDGFPSPVWVFLPIAALIAITIILWPIMRAFARRLEGKGNADSALRAELEQVHHRLSEVDLIQTRVAELEERLDFAERLLAQTQQPARLGAPTEEGGR
jgi:flagellar biosynthesis/type III secretory pathway M-ring protein FliF/YscJ